MQYMLVGMYHYIQGRSSNQCHRGMAQVDFFASKPRMEQIFSTFKMYHFYCLRPKNRQSKSLETSKPLKWHWLSLPRIGALDYIIHRDIHTYLVPTVICRYLILVPFLCCSQILLSTGCVWSNPWHVMKIRHQVGGIKCYRVMNPFPGVIARHEVPSSTLVTRIVTHTLEFFFSGILVFTSTLNKLIF